MFSGVRMLGGVFVLRSVATSHVATGKAQPQVHPALAQLKTLFTAFRVWLDLVDLIEVRANIGHTLLPLPSRAALESVCAPGNAYCQVQTSPQSARAFF